MVQTAPGDRVRDRDSDCGHSDCGAIKGALNSSRLNEMPYVKSWLGFVEPAINNIKKNYKNSKSLEVDELTRQNVLVQIKNILTYPELAKRIEVNSVDIHGWVYNIKYGSIDVYDSKEKSFIPFEKSYGSISSMNNK